MAEVVKEDVRENKEIAVARIASSVKLDSAEVEKVLDSFVLEAAMPRIYKAGGVIGALSDNCYNCDNCKAELGALKRRSELG